jgi:hypothetical protein
VFDDEEPTFANYVRFMRSNSVFNQIISKIKQDNYAPRATVDVESNKLNMLIDTGSPINCIPLSLYIRMSNRPDLKGCNTTFFGYSSNKPLPIVGQFTANIRFKQNQIQVGFVVIDGQADCLLCFRRAIDLGILSYSDTNHSSTSVASSLFGHNSSSGLPQMPNTSETHKSAPDLDPIPNEVTAIKDKMISFLDDDDYDHIVRVKIQDETRNTVNTAPSVSNSNVVGDADSSPAKASSPLNSANGKNQGERANSSPDVTTPTHQNERMQLAATAASATVATAGTDNGAQALGVQINRKGHPTREQTELNKKAKEAVEALRIQNSANHRHSERLRAKAPNASN